MAPGTIVPIRILLEGSQQDKVAENAERRSVE